MERFAIFLALSISLGSIAMETRNFRFADGINRTIRKR